MKYKLVPEKKEDYAFAQIESAPISLRKSIEIARFLKGRKLDEAIELLDQVMKKKVAVPFKKFKSAPHKPGIGPGKYPVKAAYYFMALLKNVRANAQNKGLSDDVVIYNLSADKAPTVSRYGRKRGIHAKRTHLQVIVAELDYRKSIKSEKVSKPVKVAVQKTANLENENKTKPAKVAKKAQTRKKKTSEAEQSLK